MMKNRWRTICGPTSSVRRYQRTPAIGRTVSNRIAGCGRFIGADYTGASAKRWRLLASGRQASESSVSQGQYCQPQHSQASGLGDYDVVVFDRCVDGRAVVYLEQVQERRAVDVV